MVKVKSINDLALPTRASTGLRGDTIRSDAVYVFYEPHEKILETIFSRE